MKSYAGIGSRLAPKPITSQMTNLAQHAMQFHWTLRSGGANGADKAFERGAGRKEIFLPWPWFNSHPSHLHRPSEEAFRLASAIHPNWAAMISSGRALHARNCHQILGEHLDDPVKCVICWTPAGLASGGTRTAMILARQHKIPIFNLFREEAFQFAKEFLSTCP